MRRAQTPRRGEPRDLAADDRADLHRASDPPDLPALGPPALGHIARAIRPICTASTELAARLAFEELADTCGRKYPAITRLWESEWAEFVPFLADDVEGRRVIGSINAMESLNARLGRAMRARGQVPSEQPRSNPSTSRCDHWTPAAAGPDGSPAGSPPPRLRHHLRRPHHPHHHESRGGAVCVGALTSPWEPRMNEEWVGQQPEPFHRFPIALNQRSIGCSPPPTYSSSTASPTGNDNAQACTQPTPALTTIHPSGDHHDANAEPDRLSDHTGARVVPSRSRATDRCSQSSTSSEP
jgi:hypothetical protein